jgi:hypothetical protein
MNPQAAALAQDVMSIPSEFDSDCVRCEVREGVATIEGHGWGYYVSGKQGRQMLVVALKAGQRIRINGTTECVVLEVGRGRARLGIEGCPPSGGSGTC